MEKLRYNISDLHQLSGVMSNNSRDLSISVTDFINDSRLSGVRVQVNHKQFGVLFACVLSAHGTMISAFEDNLVVEPTTKELLAELEKYGFLITYTPNKELPSNQVEYLTTLRGLGYDKLRVLSVYTYINGIKKFNWYVVAFNVDVNSNWINNGYSASEKEFIDAMKNGSAVNISAISRTKRWSWSWLDFVANIDDILQDNV